MTQTLDYARSASPRQSKLVRRVALASLFLPLLVAAPLYGEWLLATWSLGHPPRPSLDDPKDIVGSNWMHGITALAILGALPAACAALALNVLEACFNRSSGPRAVVARMSVVIISWLALLALLRWDPGAVVYWWFD